MTATFRDDEVKAELNQYWYSPRTIWALTEEVALHGTCCAFLSTPSLFFALDNAKLAEQFVDDEAARNECMPRRRALRKNSRLFEFDKQWSDDAGYTFYDFRYPDQIPVHYMGSFDYVVADPPFITEDVWEQYMRTVKMLLKKDGKVLFTTVLENHSMLEALWDGPLFIPPFFPLVKHLTYQYVCYTSYPASSAMLQVLNPEVGDVDRQVLAAIRMANDLRVSEKAFAAQMEHRDRDGEQRLPTAAYDSENRLSKPTTTADCASTRAELPISQMRWSHVPEGLTMYPDGATEAPATDATEATAASEVEKNELYQRVVALRTNVETFKNGIDQLQKILDRQMRARIQRVKERKALNALLEQPPQTTTSESDAEARTQLTAQLENAVATLSQAVDATEAERQSLLTEMEAVATLVETEEAALPALLKDTLSQLTSSATDANTTTTTTGSATPEWTLPPATYVTSMRECLASYRAVEAKRTALQELAADATRKYKSPLFNRMKELLQLMKDVRKGLLAAAPTHAEDQS